MAQASTRLPSHLLPRPKAPATSSSTTSLDTLAAGATPPHASRTSSRHRNASPNIPTDVSDKATRALIRRVLCPLSHSGLAEPRPLHELLPPLTSSNEVDLQLYAIIAIIVKEFVYSWYGKITPDPTFVEEVVRIIAHCTRDLEQRLRRVDVASLVLDEVPVLLERHIQAYRAASHPTYPSSIHSEPREVYHTLVPHPAFSPVPMSLVPDSEKEQAEHETYYRQSLVQAMLAVLLPTEDLQNPCLRTLVGDVLSDMILGKGIGGKACEGWVIWDGVTKIVASIKGQIQPKATGQEIEVGTRSRLEKFGLLSEKDENRGQRPGTGQANKRSSVISEVFWRLLQYAYLTFVTLRFILAGLIAASTAPPRSRCASKKSTSNDGGGSPIASGVQAPGGSERPVLAYSAFGLISEVLELGWRMPWVVGALSLGQWHLVGLQVGATDGLIDKFLYNLLNLYVFTPERLPSLLVTLRASLFPNNVMAPAREIPSPEEQLAIKRRAAESMLDLVPMVVAKRIFATAMDEQLNTSSTKAGSEAPAEQEGKKTIREMSKEELERETLIRGVEDILEVFDDNYMNKHMIFSIVELLFVKLLPEIQEKSAKELMEDRDVNIDGWKNWPDRLTDES